MALSPSLLTWEHQSFLLDLTLTSYTQVIRKGLGQKAETKRQPLLLFLSLKYKHFYKIKPCKYFLSL